GKVPGCCQAKDDARQERDGDQGVAGDVEHVPQPGGLPPEPGQLAVAAVEHAGGEETEHAGDDSRGAPAADQQPARDADGGANDGDGVRRDRGGKEQPGDGGRQPAGHQPIEIAVARIAGENGRAPDRGHRETPSMRGSTSRSARAMSSGKSISIHGMPSTRSKPTSTRSSSAGYTSSCSMPVSPCCTRSASSSRSRWAAGAPSFKNPIDSPMSS